MVYVVGSGPAGVSVAHALLKRGIAVTMLDAGIELERERATLVAELGRSPPQTWDPGTLTLLKSPAPSRSAIPRKLAYGSDFPYRDSGWNIADRQERVQVLSSFAAGGLSNVWGGAVMPYRAGDIEDWPVGINDLAAHYRAVFELMPLAAREDDLKREFPLYASEFEPLAPSRQAAGLLRDLDSHRASLREAGIQYGQSRLGARSKPSAAGEGCIYCGMCLYGCPRQVIYSAAHSLAELRGRPGFTYVGGTVVEAFAESRSQVEIRCRSHSGGERITFAAERLFLAGGTLGTARIALASFKTRRPLLIKDSQYFLLPMLRFEGVPGVARESLHTMAQVFLEMADCLPGARSVHLQAYTYNDLYSSMLAQRFGALARLARAPVEALLGRLIVMQGYLHSDDSSAIDVRLEGSGHEVRLVLSPRVNARAKMVARAAMRKLFKHRKHLRTIPLSPLATIGKPGEGSHVGGTFPMRRAPGELETDIFGRLKGFERVHIVDASVFPSIPATTITLSVMANAHRIGSSVPHDGPPGD